QEMATLLVDKANVTIEAYGGGVSYEKTFWGRFLLKPTESGEKPVRIKFQKGANVPTALWRASREAIEGKWIESIPANLR
ncbi:MAG TPA: hypothetical protein VGQ54_03410, partial [Burkholderiales bacterium]|nr:hypothetical protein [Burkholderiales bacterium]